MVTAWKRLAALLALCVALCSIAPGQGRATFVADMERRSSLWPVIGPEDPDDNVGSGSASLLPSHDRLFVVAGEFSPDSAALFVCEAPTSGTAHLRSLSLTDGGLPPFNKDLRAHAVAVDDGVFLITETAGHGAEMIFSDGTGEGTNFVGEGLPGSEGTFSTWLLSDCGLEAPPLLETTTNGRLLITNRLTDCEWTVSVTDSDGLNPSAVPGSPVFASPSTALPSTQGYAYLVIGPSYMPQELLRIDRSDPSVVASIPMDGIAADSAIYFAGVAAADHVIWWEEPEFHADPMIIKLWRDGDPLPTTLPSVGQQHASINDVGLFNGVPFALANEGGDGPGRTLALLAFHAESETISSSTVNASWPGWRDYYDVYGASENPRFARSAQIGAEMLICAATPGTSDYELWLVTDPLDSPVAGPLLDLRPGSTGSYPNDLTPVHDVILFTADDGVHGQEAWRTDGTAAGTMRLTDIASGGAHTFPQDFTMVGHNVFFMASDDDGILPDRGKELWAFFDTDGDGKLDPEETTDAAVLNAPGSTATNRMLADSDGDGLMDGQEDPGTAVTLRRMQAATNPRDRDTDDDGFLDGLEVRHLAVFPDGPLVADAGLTDADGDGLPASIDPDDTMVDSDNDGVRDDYEAAHGFDPASAASRPPIGDANGDGVFDVADAGILANKLLGKELAVTWSNADTTGDGFVDLSDLTALANSLVGLTVLPAW